MPKELVPSNQNVDSAIVKCSHCRQILSIDDFDSHKCEWLLKDAKQIPVMYFRDDSFDDKKVMTGYGLDGILYTFVVAPRIPIPYFLKLSDGFLQRKKSDKDLTEPKNKRLISQLIYVKAK